jgi:hypothetical protein
MAAMKHLDFRTRAGSPFNDTRGQIAKFATKKEAQKFARENGWKVADAAKAADRFFAYWVVCQCVANDLRFLGKSGEVLEVANPGYW